LKRPQGSEVVNNHLKSPEVLQTDSEVAHVKTDAFSPVQRAQEEQGEGIRKEAGSTEKDQKVPVIEEDDAFLNETPPDFLATPPESPAVHEVKGAISLDFCESSINLTKVSLEK
jgi:hypothetical protein